MAGLFSQWSCMKEELPLASGVEGDYLRKVSVDLGEMTKASGFDVLDASFFIYQKNPKTGNSILFERVFGQGSSFEFELLFNDQTAYTYDIKAYANMGELREEKDVTGKDAPSKLISLSDESRDYHQLHGEFLGITQTSASALTVDMYRYLGKVSVNEITLDWVNDHGLQEFSVVSMYLANVPMWYGSTTSLYNAEGVYESSEADELIYGAIGRPLANGESLSGVELFGYSHEACALVLECELGGEKMYYHVPCNLESNTHKAYNLKIRQIGSSTPLGELPEEAIEVSMVNFNIVDPETSEDQVEFGEEQEEESTTYELNQSISSTSLMSYPSRATVKLTSNKAVFTDLFESGAVVEGSYTGTEIVIPQGTQIGTLGALESDMVMTVISTTEILMSSEVVIGGSYDVSDISLSLVYIDPSFPFIPTDPTPVPAPGSTFSGVGVYGVDGNIYSAKAWRLSGKSKDEAVGIAVGNGQYAYVIHHTAYLEDCQWASDSYDGFWRYGNTVSSEKASSDFSGVFNTEQTLKAIEDGVITSAPAAEFCSSIEFAHGKQGYLWSAGEAFIALEHMGAIYRCFDAIHLYDFDPSDYDSDYYYLWVGTSNEYYLKFFHAGVDYDEIEQFIPDCTPNEWYRSDFHLPVWTSTLLNVYYHENDELHAFTLSTGYLSPDNNATFTRAVTEHERLSVYPVAPLGEYVDLTNEEFVDGAAILCLEEPIDTRDSYSCHYYTPEQWKKSGKSIDDVYGVAVKDGEHLVVVHPTAEETGFKLVQCTTDGINYDGPLFGLEFSYTGTFNYGVTQDLLSYIPSMSFENYYEASKDFNGADHTAEYVAACVDNTYGGGPVYYPGYIGFCVNTKFSSYNDQKTAGYLMSAGEATMIFNHIGIVNQCLEALRGVPMDMNEKMYMTSSINFVCEDLFYSWVWVGGYSNHVNMSMYFDTCNIHVRPIARL